MTTGVYILPLNFKIAPKVRGARAENFYICPSSHNAIFKNLPMLCYFLANFWKNWQILIKLYLKYQNYWKKLGILDKFLKKLVNLCNFFLFLPFYCSKFFNSAPPLDLYWWTFYTPLPGRQSSDEMSLSLTFEPGISLAVQCSCYQWPFHHLHLQQHYHLQVPLVIGSRLSILFCLFFINFLT